MEQNKKVNKDTYPDAIAILTGGTVCLSDGKYCSTTYKDGDKFGTLGGHVRVEAASILATEYPNSIIVTTGKGAGDGKSPSHASVMGRELIDLGVNGDRILKEEVSTTTKSGIEQILIIARKHNWKHIMLISNEYHIPRLSIMWDSLNPTIKADFISAEDIIIQNLPEFKETFEHIKSTPAYKKRLESEARGIEALRLGMYKSALIEDKKERLV